MLFIFGFGKKTVKIVEKTDKIRCSGCGNVRQWNYKRIISWFSLFFIPVIPYSIKYIKECPICGKAYIVDKDEAIGKINDNENVDKVELTEVQRNYREKMAALKKNSDIED